MPIKIGELPVAQARMFKCIVLAPAGDRFISHFKRLTAAQKKK